MENVSSKIRNRLLEAVKEHVFPGCVVGVVHTNGQRDIIPVGHYTYDDNSPEMVESSIFDVASLTKSIPTASLALKLIEDGKLGLRDKVCKYLPDLQNNYREQILVWHLLTFTILLDLEKPLSSLKNNSPADILKVIYTTNLKHPPGSTYQYSNAPSILLGLVINRITGKDLPTLAEEIFFGPLGMKDSTFKPADIGRVVPTEIDAERGGLLQGIVHDESAYALQKEIWPGNAGLFTTVPDLLNFLEMLLNQGMLRGKQYLKKETVNTIHTNQIANLHESTGLGWELNQPRYMGKFADENTFGKTGFTGCLVVANIQKGVAFAMLSNYVHPKRKPDAALVKAVRRDISDIVLVP